jgi:transposase-like protein
VAAAKHFFRMKNNGTPRVITLDAHAASHRAIDELKAMQSLPFRVRIRSSKYLNNVSNKTTAALNSGSAQCLDSSASILRR